MVDNESFIEILNHFSSFQKGFAPSKIATFKKIIFNYGIIVRHQTPNDTYLEVVVSCTQFHLCTPSGLGGVKVYVRTSKNLLFIIELISSTRHENDSGVVISRAPV